MQCGGIWWRVFVGAGAAINVGSGLAWPLEPGGHPGNEAGIRAGAAESVSHSVTWTSGDADVTMTSVTHEEARVRPPSDQR